MSRKYDSAAIDLTDMHLPKGAKEILVKLAERGFTPNQVAECMRKLKNKKVSQ